MDLTGARWRKSTFSNSDDGNNCVEVAFLPGGHVAMRDTKDRSLTPHFYTAVEWDAFLAGARAGDFDRS